MSADGSNEIDKLFQVMVKHQASDLHLKVGSPPLLRIAGSIRETDSKPLKGNEIRKLVYGILIKEQIEAFEEEGDLDFAYGIPGIGRFRINVFSQRGSISMAARRVNSRIPTFVELNLPDEPMQKISTFKQGLCVVAGVTGSGKSTTLAAMIEYINERRRCHIVTIEDPIEYLYTDKKSFINQREVGIDVASFESALKFVVRQDPDVILIGEMRDKETFTTALTAAETGHMVFVTVHSSTVPQTIGRILDLFPADQHDQIRRGLVFNLKAILCQKLLPSAKQHVSRVPATEVMIANPTIQKLIMEQNDKKISDVIRATDEFGMHDFNQSLCRLIKQGFISKKVGMAYSNNPEQLKMNLQGIVLGDDRRIIGG